ncbi:MAG: HIT family protein [Candidatus Saccharimonas sp.]
MEDSTFTKILKGEIPGEIIYQDDSSAVLLTIDPLTPGHCLVIPKQQVDSLWDLDSVLYHHLFDIAKQMARKIEANYNYIRVGMMVEGFGVPHAHIHVFGYTKPLEGTVQDHLAHPHLATPEELAIEAAKLRS